MSPTPGVPVTIAGKPHTLRYTNRALVAIEGELQKGGGDYRAANVLIWGGLLHEAPNVTLDWVLDMIEPHELAGLSEAASKAMETALGKARDEGPPEGNPPATG